MKFLSIVLVVFLLSFPVGGAQSRVVDRELAGLSGPVRTVTTEVARLTRSRGVSTAGDRARESVDEYDRRGDLVATAVYANGDVVERDAFRYASDGRRLGEASVKQAAAVFSLVSGGKARSRPSPSWRTTSTTAEIRYDDRGYRVSSVVSESGATGGSEISHEVFVYDALGRVAESRRLATDGTVLETTTNAYDVAGRLASSEQRRADGTLVRRAEYGEYAVDGHGNWTYRTELETDSRGEERGRRACWRAISYFEAAPAPAKPATKRAGQSDDDVASATRPRRVFPVAETTDVAAAEEPSDDSFAYSFEIADHGSGFSLVNFSSNESPYGLTRPRRVFPARKPDTTLVVATSDGDGDRPDPTPARALDPEPTRSSFAPTPTH